MGKNFINIGLGLIAIAIGLTLIASILSENAGKLAVIILILLVIGGGGGFGYKRYKRNHPDYDRDRRYYS